MIFVDTSTELIFNPLLLTLSVPFPSILIVEPSGFTTPTLPRVAVLALIAPLLTSVVTLSGLTIPFELEVAIEIFCCGVANNRFNVETSTFLSPFPLWITTTSLSDTLLNCGKSGTFLTWLLKIAIQ